MTTQPVSPHTAAKRATCPVCTAELLPARALVVPFRRHPRACRFACRECLSVVRVREQHRLHVADVEVPGPVVVRRLQALREAREAGRLGAELELLRESPRHRLLLRVPEFFAEVRPYFRERVTLAVSVCFPRNEDRPLLERYDGELRAYNSISERWTCTPFMAATGWGMPAGWALPIASSEGPYLLLKPHVVMDASGKSEPRPLPSGIAGLLAPLDVLAPDGGVW